jgi:hypothetical protein
VTKCYAVMPNISGYSLRKLLHVTLLASRILRRLAVILKTLYPRIKILNKFGPKNVCMLQLRGLGKESEGVKVL